MKKFTVKAISSVVLAAVLAVTPFVESASNVNVLSVTASAATICRRITLTQSEVDTIKAHWSGKGVSYLGYDLYPSYAKKLAVIDMQNLLNRITGAGLSPDGLYGSQTQNAVKTFQRATGVYADGLLGNATFNQLMKYVDISGTSSNSQTGSYNFAAAYNYAKTYWNQRNYNYNYYTNQNCANFVSQCMTAAGVPQTSTWRNGTYSFVNVIGLRSYFQNTYGVRYESWPSASSVNPGDVIYTSNCHVMFVMGKTSDGRVIASGNTNNRDCMIVSSLYGVLKTSELF